jgi:hypothetical protein
MTIGTHRGLNDPVPPGVAVGAPAAAGAPAAPVPAPARPEPAAGAGEPLRAATSPSPGTDPATVSWKWTAGVMFALLVVYGVLQNGLYVSNSDGEYYISVARNLALGRGYLYNGDPVGLVPPGWPIVLAGAMLISPSFAFLGWVPSVLMAAAAGLWFRALLRYTTPARAATVVILAFTLFWGYHSAILLQSEGLFCLLCAAAVLVALQIAEGRPGWWRVGLLALLCAGMVSVRWAGLSTWAIIGAILLSSSGWRWPRERQWAAVVLTLVVTVGTFAGLRAMLRSFGADGSVAAANAPHGDDIISEAPGSSDADGPGVVRNVDTQRLSRDLYAVMPRFGMPVLVERILGAGVWAGTAFWMPAKIAVSSPTIARRVNVFGWGLIIVLGVWAGSLAWRGRWVGLGVLASSFLLVIRWSSANERYLLPIAPLLILGVWWGIDRVAEMRPAWRWWRPTWRAMAAVLIGSVALCNATLWTIDAWIARSPNFYAVHHAGRTAPLVDMAKYLGERGLKDGELAVSPLYININRPAANSFGVRVMNVLTDRTIRIVPRDVCEYAPNDELPAWAAERGVRYYLYLPPVSPWRVWHWRMPWLQRRETGQTDIPTNPHWELYELRDGRSIRIDVPPTGARVTRLPGL